MTTKRNPIENAQRRVSDALVFRMNKGLEGYPDRMTPIEQLFLWELVAHSLLIGLQLNARFHMIDAWSPDLRTDGFDELSNSISGGHPESRLTIAREVEVGKYRCDFLLEVKDLQEEFRVRQGNAPSSEYPVHRHLAIECDGHDYHERTKKQAAHDRSRDRFFLEQGLSLMRFTGSELHRDGPSCAKQALKFLYPYQSYYTSMEEDVVEDDQLASFRKP